MSPIYLARHGTPQVPADIERPRIVAGPAAIQASSWQFLRDGQTVQVVVEPHVSTNDTAPLRRQPAVWGLPDRRHGGADAS